MKAAFRGLPLALGLTLIALTARGDQLHLTQPETNALSTLDENPTADVLDSAFASGGTVEGLTNIALTTDLQSVNLGVQLRAIRALPIYCPAGNPRPSCDGTAVHDALIQIVTNYTLLPAPAAQDLLRLRAAIESLGIAGTPDDVTSLVGFLDHASRDVRASTARALGSICNTQTIVVSALRTRLQSEKIPQVQLAISAALRELGQCAGS